MRGVVGVYFILAGGWGGGGGGGGGGVVVRGTCLSLLERANQGGRDKRRMWRAG